MGMPLRILKFRMDFFARVDHGFLPGDLAQLNHWHAVSSSFAF